MKLTKAESESALWKKLETHFQDKLDGARINNDHNYEILITSNLRGRIQAYKEILELNPEDQTEE